MGKIIHLEELALAKRVVREYPQAILDLDICINRLYNNRELIDIATSINQLRESKYLMEITLEVYMEILKGIKSEQTET